MAKEKKSHAVKLDSKGKIVARCGSKSTNLITHRMATCLNCNPDGVIAVTVLVGGQTLSGVHGPLQCAGEFCTIHNNSDHHMVTWSQNWRGDRGLMERICPHGVGHPDPDDPKLRYPSEGVHDCDGCCFPGSPLNGYWERCCDGGCECCDIGGWVYLGNDKD